MNRKIQEWIEWASVVLGVIAFFVFTPLVLIMYAKYIEYLIHAIT